MPAFKLINYSWPLLTASFASADLTNSGLKIFGVKNPESSKKQNLNLPGTDHYAGCIVGDRPCGTGWYKTKDEKNRKIS